MQNEYPGAGSAAADPTGMISQAQLTTTNPALFTSHANLSNNEIPLDRSIYSDTILTHNMIDQMAMSQGL